MTHKLIPIDTRSLFAPLDERLIELLESLTPQEWSCQTIAKAWKVKDVTSHLLDGDLRVLSIQRDNYFGESPPTSTQYEDIVIWLNQLNADWVSATRRLSPTVLTMLLKLSGKLVTDYFNSLDPWEEAVFSVAWAGEDTSYNWMHVAREYTERWHHQQQIREAVGKQGIMSHELFYPVLDTFFQALPHTFRHLTAPQDTVVQVSITTEAGGDWFLIRNENNWRLSKSCQQIAAAYVEIPANVSWQLFTKSLRPRDIEGHVTLRGDKALGSQVLNMISVMA